MDPFLSACGADGPLVLGLEGPGIPAGERIRFDQPYLLIGRDDRADVVLDHDAVSRRHAYVQVVEGRVFVIDLDSRTGTFVDDAAVESGWVAPGQTLGVGPYRFRPEPFHTTVAQAGDNRANPLLARSSQSSNLPRVSLEFQSRSSGHSIWRMNPVLALVGSSARCKVRLLDSNLSKLHCALTRTPQGLWVVDLLSRNGITVNGISQRSAKLEPGDILGLGQVTVRANLDEGSTHEGIAVPVSWRGAQQRPTPPPPGPAPFAMPLPVPMPFATDVPPPQTGTTLAANEPALAMLLNHFGQMQQQMLDQFQQSMFMMLQMFSGMHRDQMGLVREELDRLRDLNNELAQIKSQMATRPGPPGAMPMPPPAPRARVVNGQYVARAQSPQEPATPHEPPVDKTAPLEPAADVHDWLNERLTALTTEQQTRWQRVMGLIRGGGAGGGAGG